MELYEEPVSCRTFQYLFLDAYHLLVIAVHEVHHESFYSPSLIERKGFFEFVVQRSPVYPQMYANPLAPCIFHNSRHVQARYRFCNVRIGSRPSEIEVVIIVPRSLRISVDSMCIQAIACCKIDVVLVCIEVVPRRERAVRHDIPVPPCERVLQGLIHEVSSILQGSFRLVSIFVSSNPPTRSATEITRHGVRCGKLSVSTFIFSCPSFGESFPTSPPFSFTRYIPA